MKIFKIILVVLICIYISFSIYRYISLAVDNSILRNALQEQEIISDSYNQQLNEIAYIFEQTCSDKDKYSINKSILKYREKKEEELRKLGIEFIEIPEINIELASVLYGYNGNLKFYFSENGKLKEVEYPQYGAVYKNILNGID